MFAISAPIASFLAQSDIKVRPNADSGIWLMFLLPLSLIISSIKHPLETSQIFKYSAGLSAGLIGTSMIFIVQCIKKQPLTINRTLHLIPAAITATLFRFVFNTGFFFSFISGLVSTICYWNGMLMVFTKFPRSFTVGELGVAAQALILFCYSTFLNLYTAILQVPFKVSEISTIIIQVGLCAVATIIILMHKYRNLRDTVTFYIVTTAVLFIFVVIILTTVLRQSALLWIFIFVFEDISRSKMMLYWSLCCVGAIIAVNKQITGKQRATPAVRKIFHLFTVAVYIPGLIYQCSLIYLASGVILGIFAMLEVLRILNIPPFGSTLQKGFVMYRDEKDTGHIALTPIYLLIGCSLPMWLHPAPCDILDSAGFNLLPVMSGVLAIGVGDTAASVVGTSVGKHFWPGTKKTVEGTIGCIISQLTIIWLLVCLGLLNPNQYALLKAVAAVVIGSLVEASTNQIDNIVLPLILFIILC
ncbi:hypothetical protein FQR65_LT08898 [Abscondita terminalis]|nr:hypothetical protein FQR65_LT08898 [Abscondita terminalis]